MSMLKWLLVAIGVLLCLGAGCAPRADSALAPHEGELLSLEQTERIVPAKIGVEGRREEVRLVLVPSYEEPELTPEERAALGEEPELIDWLEFYVPQPSVVRTWPGTGGPHAGIGGIGGPGAGVGGLRRAVSTGELRKDVASGYAVEASCARSATRAERPTVAVGSGSGIRVGEGGVRRVSAHQTRPER